MPASWHRLNSNGTLVKLKGLYRLNSDGTLAKIKAAYRLNSNGTLVKVFAGLAEPSVKVASPPYLYMVDPSGFADPEISAYTSYKMYLTRGKWNEDPLEFIMKIQRSTSSTFSSVTDLVSLTKTYTTYNDSDFEFEVPTNTADRPVITNALIRAGNYYRGSVKATNSDDLFDTYLTPVVKPRIDAQLNIIANLGGTIGTNPTATGGTFSWLYNGYESIVAADVFSQTISFYPQGNTSGTPIYSQSVSPGTSTTSAPLGTAIVSNSALQANTTYTVVVSSVMNDLWKTESDLLKTIVSDFGDFTTAADKPATPSITSATDVGTNRPYNNGAVSLSWTQPSGGSTVTGYKIEYSVGPEHIFIAVLNANTGSTSTSGTFTGLDANKNYKFYVTALGTTQNSDRSNASSSVLITTVPDVPRLVGAFAGNAQATVFWELPTAAGGKSILDYRATSNPGGITGTVNALEVIVTGLTNYTAYTFTVAARNANGYSAESSASNSVTPQLPLPVGSGTVTITYVSETSYEYKITGYGTWSNSATKYDYEWQTSPNNSTWTTRSSGTDVSTIPNYNAAAYKGNFIRLRVYGRNQTGPAVTPLVSATTTIFYTTPVINSFTVTGGNSSVSYSYSYSADDPTVAVEIGYKLSSATTYTTISSPASSGTINLTSGTYDFRLFVTNSAAGAFRTGAAYVTGVTVVSPTISGISIYNATLFPSAASSISVSNTPPSNTGSVTWLNNSNTSFANLRSVTGSGSLQTQSDPTSKLTAGTFIVVSTGEATATIRAINTSKLIGFSWSQSNAQSYRISYSIAGVPGTSQVTGNSSLANPSVTISAGANTYTLINISVYPQQDQQGTPVTLSAPAGTTATGADRVTDTTGSGSVTYTVPLSSPSGGSASISGTATMGNNLTLTKTDATGNPSPTVSWKWQRNDAAGASYRDIQTDGSTYSLTRFDAGYNVRVSITWTNSQGNQNVITGSIGPIAAIYWTITYDSQGGSAVTSTDIVQGATGNVTATVPTRSGYSFGGWNTAANGSGTNYTSNALITPTSNITLYAKWTASFNPVVWGTMPSPAFSRGTSSLRWGWNNQLPTSGDYTASNITWEWQYSSTNSTTGLISSGTRPNRAAGGLTVGASTYNNRVSSISTDYTTGGTNDAGVNEPIPYSIDPRYLRYRAVVVGSNGTTYRSNYSAWV